MQIWLKMPLRVSWSPIQKGCSCWPTELTVSVQSQCLSRAKHAWILYRSQKGGHLQYKTSTEDINFCICSTPTVGDNTMRQRDDRFLMPHQPWQLWQGEDYTMRQRQVRFLMPHQPRQLWQGEDYTMRQRQVRFLMPHQPWQLWQGEDYTMRQRQVWFLMPH